jgi:hypothetical protein
MILACRVLRSSVGQGSCRSQRMDGLFGTHRGVLSRRARLRTLPKPNRKVSTTTVPMITVTAPLPLPLTGDVR